MENNYQEKEKKVLYIFTLVWLIRFALTSFGSGASVIFDVGSIACLVLIWAVFFLSSQIPPKVRGYLMLFIIMANMFTYYNIEVETITIFAVIINSMMMVSFLERKDLSWAAFLFGVFFVILDIVLVIKGILKLRFSVSVYLFNAIQCIMAFFILYRKVVAGVTENQIVEGLNEEAERVRTGKDEFMANVSHELRTPLNLILGHINQFHEQDFTPRMRENFGRVKIAVKRLETIIADVMDYSELQTGSYEINEENYNITEVINECVNAVIAANENKKLDVIIDCDPNIPLEMFCDKAVISRIITNVVENAIKFTESGFVYISVGSRKESYGVNLVFRVEDSGSGIEKETLENIFEYTYNQEDSSSKRRAEGIGIGLPLTKLLLTVIDGLIHIDSEVGKGTTVTITIPQKVMDDKPSISVDRSDNIRLALYDTARGYNNSDVSRLYWRVLENMAQKTRISVNKYDNLKEIERAIERGTITHVMMTSKAYIQNWEVVDELPEKVKIIIVQSAYLEPPFDIRKNFRILYEPFYTGSIASLLNDEDHYALRGDNLLYQFVAPKARILAVDDNAMNIRVLESFLKPYKVKLYRANSGMEAIEAVKNGQFDLIFMDYMMPQMDGIETLHRIRKEKPDYCRTVPVVALTANAVSGARNMFISEGFCDYLIKPVNISSLENALKSYLPKELLEDSRSSKDNSDNEALEKDVKRSSAKEERKTPDEQESSAQRDKAPGLIDKAVGLKYSCDDEGLYLALVEVYAQDAPENIQKMEEHFKAEDYKEYTVLTHALKSNSLQIGAVALSEEAKAMEMAGKAGDVEFLKKGHEPLMEHYKKVLEEISSKEI